jgi:hypothetical protein
LVSALFAQEEAALKQYMTGPFMNGRYWEKISDFQKQAFLLGFRDAVLTTYELSSMDKEIVADRLMAKLYLAELQAEIDSFYKEGANGPLPISIAYQYSVKKAHGASSKELEEFLAGFRKMYAEDSK